MWRSRYLPIISCVIGVTAGILIAALVTAPQFQIPPVVMTPEGATTTTKSEKVASTPEPLVKKEEPKAEAKEEPKAEEPKAEVGSGVGRIHRRGRGRYYDTRTAEEVVIGKEEVKKEEIRDTAQELAKKTLTTNNIAYNTPETIQLGDTAVVQLELSPSFSVDELKAMITEPGKKEGESIFMPFSRRVEAHLTGSAFKIVPLGTEIARAVEPGAICEWSWEVTPTQSGTHLLSLTIDAVVVIEGKDAAREKRVFGKPIRVNVTLVQMVAGFISNNWQWLWAVGLVPLGGWMFERVRRKRHGQNEEQRTKPERVSPDQAESLSLGAEGIPSVWADSKSNDQKGPKLPPAPPS